MHRTWEELRERLEHSLMCLRWRIRSATGAGSAVPRQNRLLRRMEAGVVRSLEVEDASPTSTALMTLQRWMERIAEKEVERITAKCQRYQEQGKPIPTWVRAGWMSVFGAAGRASRADVVRRLLG